MKNQERFIRISLLIIVILLIVMNFLLWDISHKIGHDYIYTGEHKWMQQGIEKDREESKKEGVILPSGLYRTIYNTKPEIPYFDDEFKKIIDRLDWIDNKLSDIKWNTR
jgi:hypothetical protein